MIHCIQNIHFSQPNLQRNLIGMTGLSFLPSLQSFSGLCELPQLDGAAYQRQTKSFFDRRPIYTELRQPCHRSEYCLSPGNVICLTMTKTSSQYTPYQFINRLVKNGMNGPEAFFDEIFHSMSKDEQSTVKQLSD